jgi:hypothetical protein
MTYNLKKEGVLSFIERVEPEAGPVAPVVPRHPKSYMEVSYLSKTGVNGCKFNPYAAAADFCICIFEYVCEVFIS